MTNSVYVHIPFCAAKCNYCAFNSKVADDSEREMYVDSLITEIKNRATSKEIGTVYFGGGTPSILNVEQLGQISGELRKNFFIRDDAEITVEVNPGTVDEIYLHGLHEIGFNRLSVGVQSFNDELLKILGRIHDSKVAVNTIKLAKKFFNNISIDLMYGLPSQTLEDVRRDIDILADMDIQHVSIYGLEIEEGTKFGAMHAAGKLSLPEDSDMYDYITENLPLLGYRRYEISNFSRRGFESRHNLGYWTDVKYLGIGAGAHSYDGKRRTSNVRNVNEYIKKIRAGAEVSKVEEIVTHEAAMEEFCFLGLRTVQGLDIDKFAEKFGISIFKIFGNVIEKNIKIGLLENSCGRIFLTPRGMKFGNVVFADFLF